MKIAGTIGYGLLLAIVILPAGFVNASWAAPPARTLNQTPLPIFIMEDDFEPEEWTVTAEAIGGATYTVTQQLTGGFSSPPFRFMSHRFPPVPSGLTELIVTHIYLDAGYDPSLQGALRAIDYAEAGIILSFPFPDALSTTQPVVVQGGRVYRSTKFLRFVAANSSHAWETKSLSQLTAADFIEVGGSETDHPDFSASGGPLQFGFARRNSRNPTQPAVPGDQDLVIDQGVDNWRLILYRESEDDENRSPQAVDDVFVLDGYKRSLPLFEIFDVVRNDSDPDQDFLEIVEVTAPTYGTAGSLSEHTLVYQLDEARSSDTFGYTISDDALTSAAQVEVYFDCACTVTCLNNLELPERSLIHPPDTMTGTMTDTIDLPLIYRVRDHILKPTSDGRRYVDMYYTSNPEILVNIVMNEDLRNEAVLTVELWQENLRSLVDGDGSAVIAQAQVDALSSFLTHLSAISSTGLQAVIAGELARLGPLDDYVGLSMKEAKRQAIGDATLYLPLLHSRQ